MSSALVAALAAPILEVQAMVGPGWSGDRAVEPGAVLGDVGDALAGVAAAASGAWAETAERWRGTGADGAAQFAASAITALATLARRADQLGAGADAAAAAVAQASARLRTIVDRFEERAAVLEPQLDSPGVLEELVAEARSALAEAVAVVEGLHGQLDGAVALTAAAAPTGPAPTAPAGFAGQPSLGAESGAGSGGWSGTGSGGGLGAGSGGWSGGGGPGGWSGAGSGGWSGMGAGVSDLVSTARAADSADMLADPHGLGEGVLVRLPDGSTVTAPNAVAGDAVRHALTQLGVPYDWGGTTPGVGLDCSGLTQWAYREAGLDIPRLAQEQDVGATVSAGALRPGDLAVWDGHVAMIVGDGMMIEAGDPVQLSPIRTTNAGQGFHGFFRPTS